MSWNCLQRFSKEIMLPNKCFWLKITPSLLGSNIQKNSTMIWCIFFPTINARGFRFLCEPHPNNSTNDNLLSWTIVMGQSIDYCLIRMSGRWLMSDVLRTYFSQDILLNFWSSLRLKPTVLVKNIWETFRGSHTAKLKMILKRSKMIFLWSARTQKLGNLTILLKLGGYGQMITLSTFWTWVNQTMLSE